MLVKENSPMPVTLANPRITVLQSTPMIFPQLNRWSHQPDANLNEEAIRYWKEIGHTDRATNPLLSAQTCQKMVDAFHRRLGKGWSYGGYMEDRSTIWAGSFLENENRFLHLGVDLNIPAGAEVTASERCTVEHVDGLREGDHNNNWGTRVFLRPHNENHPILMYAHLSASIRKKVGEIVKPDEVFAHIGSSMVNGGWYEHCHLQGIDRAHFAHLVDDDGIVRRINGYAKAEQEGQMRQMYPDATPYVDLPRIS